MTTDDGFQFGDRVEVVSGPWDGVRGTVVDVRPAVIGFDAEGRQVTKRSAYGVRIDGVCYTFVAAALMAVES